MKFNISFDFTRKNKENNILEEITITGDKIKPIEFKRVGYKLKAKNISRTAIEELFIECDDKEIKTIIIEEVINQCSNSKHSIDLLALAFAKKLIIMNEDEKDPNYRNIDMINETIYLFEKWMDNPRNVPDVVKNKCDLYNICSSLAYLNECRENWDEAISYLEKVKICQMSSYPKNPELETIYYMMLGTTSRRIGELKIKQGNEKAIEYYNILKRDSLYRNENYQKMVKSFIDYVENKLIK